MKVNTQTEKSKKGCLVFLVLFVIIYLLSTSKDNFEGQSLIGGKIMYTSTDLNVRSKPSINGEKIKTLLINSKILTSKEINDGWVFIGEMDSTALGFVSSKFLQNISFTTDELNIIKAKKATENAKKANQPASSSEDLLAYSYAEEYVKQNLKSPSSAEFPGIWDGKRDHITNLGNREYKIVSYVDSQNGFGAMIRTNWSCIIYFYGDKIGCRELNIN